MADRCPSIHRSSHAAEPVEDQRDERIRFLMQHVHGLEKTVTAQRRELKRKADIVVTREQSQQLWWMALLAVLRQGERSMTEADKVAEKAVAMYHQRHGRDNSKGDATGDGAGDRPDGDAGEAETPEPRPDDE